MISEVVLLNLDNLKNNIENTLDIISKNISEAQDKFLKSNFGQALNSALDLGIQIVMPDLIEDEVIDVKNAILDGGLKAGFNSAIESLKNIKDSAIGIITGTFDNISQIQTAVKKGGLIDTASSLIDTALEKAEDKGLISKDIQKEIKKGKNTILNKLNDNISENLENQVKYLEKVNEYNEKWQECYEKQDFDGMERAYKNLKKYMEKCIPFENVINTARKNENIHSIIKNNIMSEKDDIFNLTENQLELSEALV